MTEVLSEISLLINRNVQAYKPNRLNPSELNQHSPCTNLKSNIKVAECCCINYFFIDFKIQKLLWQNYLKDLEKQISTTDILFFTNLYRALWNDYQDSDSIKYQRSMCWQPTNTSINMSLLFKNSRSTARQNVWNLSDTIG